VIINRAFGPCGLSKLCTETIALFASILTSEAAYLALKVLATGGVYVAGGGRSPQAGLHAAVQAEGPSEWLVSRFMRW
jgi:glucokinase